LHPLSDWSCPAEGGGVTAWMDEAAVGSTALERKRGQSAVPGVGYACAVELRERFLAALDHIEAHLGEPLELADVAKRAGLSMYYFSRVFRVFTGETFGGYVRSRRLTRAAERLTREPVPLIDLALDCGYESQEAFTRAFKRRFGLTPGSYRARPPRGMPLPTRIDAHALDHLMEVLDMEPEIAHLDAFTVVGQRGQFDPDTKHRIPELWERVLPLLPRIARRRGDLTYGVCLNAEPSEGSFDYVAGVEVEAVEALPPELCAETLPPQTYAIFRHTLRSTSLHEELQPTLRWIWGTWIPGAPYEYRGGPDFERYPPDFDPSAGRGYLDIAVPVHARA